MQTIKLSKYVLMGMMLGGLVGITTQSQSPKVQAQDNFSYQAEYYKYDKQGTIVQNLENKIQKYSGAMVAMTFLTSSKDKKQYPTSNTIQTVRTMDNLSHKIGVYESNEQVFNKLNKPYKMIAKKVDQYINGNTQLSLQNGTQGQNISQKDLMIESYPEFSYYYDSKNNLMKVVLEQTVGVGNIGTQYQYTVYNFDMTGTPIGISEY